MVPKVKGNNCQISAPVPSSVCQKKLAASVFGCQRRNTKVRSSERFVSNRKLSRAKDLNCSGSVIWSCAMQRTISPQAIVTLVFSYIFTTMKACPFKPEFAK